MNDKVYLVIEDIDSEDWGKFQVAKYWFESESEAIEFVSEFPEKSYAIQEEDKQIWLDCKELH